MGSLGEQIGNWGSLIFSGLGAFQTQQQYEEARAQNEQRYLQGLQLLGGSDRRNWDTFNTGYSDLADFYGSALPYLSADAATLGGTVTDAYGRRAGDVFGGFQRGSQNIRERYGNRTSEVMGLLSPRLAEANRRYAARTAQGLGYLDDSTAQGRADINERYDAFQSQNEQDLLARGLTASSVAPGVRSLTDRERGAELRRFDEGVRREYLDAFAQLSGDELQALMSSAGAEAGMLANLTGEDLDSQGRLLGLESTLATGLTQDQLAALERGGERSLGFDENAMRILADLQERATLGRIGLDTDMTNRQLGWIGGRTDTYPQTNAWTQLAGELGQFADGRNASSGGGGVGNSWVAPTIGAVGTAATTGLASYGAGLAASAIFFICVDSDATINTMTGPKKLNNIKEGDDVLSADGYYRKVLKINVNTKPKELRSKYLKLTVDSGESLIVSPEHLVRGKPALSYQPGDTLEMFDGMHALKSVEECPYRRSGDLMLEDNAAYVANGFIVNSMIGSLGLENYETAVAAIAATAE